MIYIGDSKIGGVKVGTDTIASMMIGTDQVYSSSQLPAGYTELPYVSSVDGGGWVDTDILPSDTLGFKAVFKAHVINPRDNNVMGAREDSGNTRYVLGIYNGKAFAAWLTYPSTSEQISISADTWYTASVNFNNSRTWSINTTTKSLTGTQGAFTKTFQLFGFNRAAGHGAATESSVKRLTFTLGTDIIADMIPCTSPNNEVGFYDIVRERFFGSGNGTPLIAGS